MSDLEILEENANSIRDYFEKKDLKAQVQQHMNEILNKYLRAKINDFTKSEIKKDLTIYLEKNKIVGYLMGKHYPIRYIDINFENTLYNIKNYINVFPKSPRIEELEILSSSLRQRVINPNQLIITFWDQDFHEIVDLEVSL